MNNLEQQARRMAKKHGFRVCKSRQRSQHMNNKGGLQLIDYHNNVVLGVDFDASPNDVIKFIEGQAAKENWDRLPHNSGPRRGTRPR
jgi:hypothetical protein